MANKRNTYYVTVVYLHPNGKDDQDLFIIEAYTESAARNAAVEEIESEGNTVTYVKVSDH